MFFICLLTCLLLLLCSMKILRDFYFADWRFFEVCGNKFLRREFGLKFPLGTNFCGFLFKQKDYFQLLLPFGKKNPSIIENVEKMWHPGGLRKWLTWPFDWLLWVRFLCPRDWKSIDLTICRFVLFVASSSCFFSKSMIFLTPICGLKAIFSYINVTKFLRFSILLVFFFCWNLFLRIKYYLQNP